MRLELAERLRCPRAHAPTPLIVVAQRTHERELVEGFAGCPVCHLEARITAGDVAFPDGVEVAAPSRLAPTDDRVQRTAALLGLADPGGAVLLSGRYATLAAALAQGFGVTAILLGAREAAAATAPVAGVRAPAGTVPFADGTFRAAALETAFPDALRSVAVGGHVLAPAAAPLIAGLAELARDPEEWVARREPAAQPVAIARRQSSSA